MRAPYPSSGARCACGFSSLLVAAGIYAQSAAVDTSEWTAEQEHRNMMEQLGITEIRRGPNGRAEARAPNAAYPQIEVNIEMSVVVPAEAKGPVPLLGHCS